MAQLAVLALVFACSNAPTPARSAIPPYQPLAPAVRGGTLVVADWEAPSDLDPLTATTETSLRAANLLFAPLWSVGPGLVVYPGLAERPAVKVSGSTMTVDVRLRPQARWSDGSPVTAADVILTWKALADPTTGAFAVPGLEHIRDMQAVSDGEVVWTLDTYGGYLALGAALTPLPAARLGAVAHAQWRGSAFFAHPELASGPFAVGSAGPGVLSLVANPQYSLGGHPAYLDRALLRTYPSKGAMLRALQTGEADVSFHLDPSDVGQLKGLPGSQASSALGLRDEFLRPNPQAGPWAADTTLLAALAQALDRQALVTLAVGDEGRASRGLFPSALAGWNDPSLPAPASDPAAAVQRLEADGWKAGADGVRVKGGRRLAFTVIAYCASPVVSATLSRLSDEWGKVGAAVTTACRSHAELAQADAAGAFEMALESNRWAPDPDAWTALAGRCADPALAADFSAGASTVDSARRHSAYRTAEKEWLAVQCTIPLFEWPDVAAVSSRLRNFFPDPSSLDVWNAADWWLAAA